MQTVINYDRGRRKICSTTTVIPKTAACHLSFDVVKTTRTNVTPTEVKIDSHWTDRHLESTQSAQIKDVLHQIGSQYIERILYRQTSHVSCCKSLVYLGSYDRDWWKKRAKICVGVWASGCSSLQRWPLPKSPYCSFRSGCVVLDCGIIDYVKSVKWCLRRWLLSMVPRATKICPTTDLHCNTISQLNSNRFFQRRTNTEQLDIEIQSGF